MNILFLTLLDFSSLNEHNIYTDLLREFAKHNHKVYIISPIERRKKQESQLIETDEVVILKLKIGNIQKTNILEKGFRHSVLNRCSLPESRNTFCRLSLIWSSIPHRRSHSAMRFSLLKRGTELGHIYF